MEIIIITIAIIVGIITVFPLIVIEEAKKFLTDNNIKYTILTSIEGYSKKRIIEQYPFLRLLYENPDIYIMQ